MKKKTHIIILSYPLSDCVHLFLWSSRLQIQIKAEGGESKGCLVGDTWIDPPYSWMPCSQVAEQHVEFKLH